MSISLTNESKNGVSLTLETKQAGVNAGATWDEATFTWDDAVDSTWGDVGTVIYKEIKNNVSLTLETKQ